MNLTDIETMAETDLKISKDDLVYSSIETPNLFNKYQKLFNREALILKKLKSDYDILYRDVFEYYCGKKSEEELKEMGRTQFNLKVMKQDLSVYINSDKEVNELQTKIYIQQQKVSYLEEILKQINSRQWTIRNIIEWNKFTSGII